MLGAKTGNATPFRNKDEINTIKETLFEFLLREHSVLVHFFLTDNYLS